GVLAPSQSIIDAYDPADERLAWNITLDDDDAPSGTKWPTTAGAEDLHVIRVDVTSQDEVLAAIDLERRLELAFEGDRWPDLVRTGQAVAVLGIPESQALFPIPQSERDVAPGVTQNP